MQKIGLLIGKFMPLHKGHVALIEFALSHCDKLIIGVCSDKTEPVDGKIRFKWVKETFKSNPKVLVKHIYAALPHNPIPTYEGSLTWGSYLKKRFPDATVLFSSEKYGAWMNDAMKIENVLFDPSRQKINVSGTMIRENPKKYLDFITPVAREYFLVKN